MVFSSASHVFVYNFDRNWIITINGIMSLCNDVIFALPDVLEVVSTLGVFGLEQQSDNCDRILPWCN